MNLDDFMARLGQGQMDPAEVIGQFGVGFYSALMVADRVEVRSLSAEPDAEAIVWSCDGSTSAPTAAA